MPMSKEEKAAYDKDYREKNIERIKIMYKKRRESMTDEQKAKQREKDRAYSKTPARIKSNRISNWKHKDIIVPDNDFDKFYDEFLSVEICQKKVSCNGAILTYDKQATRTTRCVDHDHNINDKPNVRFICCHACNANDNLSNTSGESNIIYIKKTNRWLFEKTVKGITYYSPQGYKNIDDAINFKIKWLSDFKNGLIPH